MATVHNVTRTEGIAGQYAMTATVSYPGYSDERTEVTFVATRYGSPIVMRTAGFETFVSPAVLDRIGDTLTRSWVHAFFAEREPHTCTHGPDSYSYNGANGCGWYVSVCGVCGVKSDPVCTG